MADLERVGLYRCWFSVGVFEFVILGDDVSSVFGQSGAAVRTLVESLVEVCHSSVSSATFSLNVSWRSTSFAYGL